MAPAVYRLRLAHLRAEHEQLDHRNPDNPGPDNDGQRGAAPLEPALAVGSSSGGGSGVSDVGPSRHTSQPDARAPALGVRVGREIALDLAAARGLGLVGDGTSAAARVLLITARTPHPVELGRARTHGPAPTDRSGSTRNACWSPPPSGDAGRFP